MQIIPKPQLNLLPHTNHSRTWQKSREAKPYGSGENSVYMCNSSFLRRKSGSREAENPEKMSRAIVAAQSGSVKMPDRVCVL